MFIYFCKINGFAPILTVEVDSGTSLPRKCLFILPLKISGYMHLLYSRQCVLCSLAACIKNYDENVEVNESLGPNVWDINQILMQCTWCPAGIREM